MGKKVPIDLEVHGKDLGAGSMLDGLAMKAKKLRMEDRLSGESALSSFLNRGPGGLADLGMSAIGAGALGIVANQAGLAASSLTKSLMDIQEGKQTLGDALATFAEGIPVVGGFGKALANLNDMMTGSAARLTEMNAKADESARQRGDATAVLGKAGSVIDAVYGTGKDKSLMGQLKEQYDIVSKMDEKFASERRKKLWEISEAIRALSEQQSRDATQIANKAKSDLEAAKNEYGRGTSGILATAKQNKLRADGRDADADFDVIDQGVAERKRQALMEAGALTGPGSQGFKYRRERDAAIDAEAESQRELIRVRMQERAQGNILQSLQKNSKSDFHEPPAPFLPRAATGTSFENRFTTGLLESMLAKSSPTDVATAQTAKNTKDLVDQSKALYQLMLRALRSGGDVKTMSKVLYGNLG